MEGGYFTFARLSIPLCGGIVPPHTRLRVFSENSTEPNPVRGHRKPHNSLKERKYKSLMLHTTKPQGVPRTAIEGIHSSGIVNETEFL